MENKDNKSPVEETEVKQETNESAEEQQSVDPAGKAEEAEETGPGVLFDFADVYFSCSVCGNDVKVAEALRGISFTVPAGEKTDVRMECTKCGSVLKLYFKEADEEAKEKRKAEIAEQEEQMKKENGTSQENSEEKPGQGASDDSERSAETDEQTAGDTASVDAAGQSVEA